MTSTTDVAGGEPREFDEIVDELYALRPDAFIAARDEQVRAAREAGRRDLARELGKLRRPTQSAWLVNLVRRDQPAVVDELIELGDEMATAHTRGSPSDLHELTSRRRELEGRLVRRARALAEEAGVPATADMAREAQETLAAALADPEAAAEVRSGRLVRPVSYSGFGAAFPPMPTSAAPAEAAAAAGPASRGTPTGTRRRRAREREDRPAEREDRPARDDEARRDRELERRVAEARAAVESAEQELAERVRAAEEAVERRADLGGELDRTRAELRRVRERVRDLEQQVASADGELRSASRRREAAERKRAAAVRELDRVTPHPQ